MRSLATRLELRWSSHVAQLVAELRRKGLLVKGVRRVLKGGWVVANG